MTALAAIVVFTSVGCGPKLRYPLRPDTIRIAPRPKNLTVAIATVMDDRPQIEKEFYYREELMGDEAYGYTEDLSFGTSFLPDAVTDQMVRHLDYSGAFRYVDRAPFDGDLSMDKLRREITGLRGQYDIVVICKMTHFYGYDEGGFPRAIDAHVEFTDITFIATRNLRPVFKTSVSVKVREAESEKDGNQYSHAIEAFRTSMNDLVGKVASARITNR